MLKPFTVGDYLAARLCDAGLKHIFGVPGDYVLGFYDVLEASPIEVVGTCNEAGAGFAADAYARVTGLGAICVTYCVGGFNALNAVAGAYAEKSPLILISGAPGLSERVRSPLLHHCVSGFTTQRQVFEKVCAAAEALEDPGAIPAQIDTAIARCMRYKRPIYFELPRDVVHLPCKRPKPWRLDPPASDPDALREALAESAQMLRRARRGVILGDVEVHRFGLQAQFRKLVEQSRLPVAATLLGKSVIGERHPNYIGIYEGAMGRDACRRTVERADCVLYLGAFLTDINLGVFTSKLDPAKTIIANAERISIQHHHYENVVLNDFIEGLARMKLGTHAHRIQQPPDLLPVTPQKSRPLSVARFFRRINGFLRDDTLVIADIGDSLFGAADLTIHRGTEFLSPAYYTSMGWAVPAALGAQIGKPGLRPLVLVGDGAFQMTSQELSTIARRGLNPIVIVMNNKGYTTERLIHDGPYNNIHEWAYHRMPELLGAGQGFEAKTEGELEDALDAALKNTASFSIINAHFDSMDHSEALSRLGKSLASRVDG